MLLWRHIGTKGDTHRWPRRKRSSHCGCQRIYTRRSCGWPKKTIAPFTAWSYEFCARQLSVAREKQAGGKKSRNLLLQGTERSRLHVAAMLTDVLFARAAAFAPVVIPIGTVARAGAALLATVLATLHVFPSVGLLWR